MNRLTKGILALLCCLSMSAAAGDGDLPPAGRSRFDFLVGDAPVPYPLPRLIARIRAQLEASDDGLSPIKITLIPLGRSLRRSVAAPDFFHFPSVVAVVDGNAKAGYLPLRDQLFIGYNERAESVEIISYNEQAGRFEFQVVRDYRAGAQPKLYYANRALCLTCHQNSAPIFSRALWDETPANPAVASRLKATGRDFYGIPISGTDISNAIDAAAARANLFPVWQQIWREACGAECRAQWLDAALAYALSGNLPEAGELKFADLDTRWTKTWPQGLSIPGSSFPNRDPFAHVVETPVESRTALPDTIPELAELAYIPPQLEPLTPRPPMQRWATPDKTQLVAGLAGLLNKADVQAFDQALAMHTKAQPQTRTLPCRFTRKPGRVVFNCATPDIHLSGVIRNAGSALREMEFSKVPYKNYAISAKTNPLPSPPPRCAQGRERTPSSACVGGERSEGDLGWGVNAKGAINGTLRISISLSAQIDRLQVGLAKTALDLHLSGSMNKTGQIELIPKHGASWIRLSDGRRWSRLQLDTLPADQGSATLTLIDDYAAVRVALPHLPLMAASVFDGGRALAELQTALGLPRHKISGREIPANKLPPAVTN